MSKAKERLGEFADYSPNFETFKSIFLDNLDSDRVDEAITILLKVVFEMLKSEGEKFNQLLNRVDPTDRERLIAWLNAQNRRKR